MSGRNDDDEPLARYLADMLTESPGPGDGAVSPSSPPPVAGEETTPAASDSDETEDVVWWGFGVAHLILVLAGEDVAGVEESVPPGLEWTAGQAGQGRHRLRGGERELVDPAMVILPPAHRSQLPPLEARASGLIHLRGSDVSLVTGSEPLPVNLTEDEVRWRMEKGGRPWMAGTVMSRNLVVLDAAGLSASVSGRGE